MTGFITTDLKNTALPQISERQNMFYMYVNFVYQKSKTIKEYLGIINCNSY